MNLIEGIQAEQKRFREELIPAYESIGGEGKFALLFVLKPLLIQSDVAIACGDVTAMVKVLAEMRAVQA